MARDDPSWDVDNEKLLCHILLDDSYAPMLSTRAGPAFFRAFIVENRATGQLSMKFRFKYQDGKRNWFRITPTDGGKTGIEELRKGVRSGLKTSAIFMGIPLPEDAVKFFDPPDDGGDGMKTVAWLVERDLIEVSVEEMP